MKRGSIETANMYKHDSKRKWCLKTLMPSLVPSLNLELDLLLGLEENITSQTYTFNNHIDKHAINMPKGAKNWITKA